MTGYTITARGGRAIEITTSAAKSLEMIYSAICWAYQPAQPVTITNTTTSARATFTRDLDASGNIVRVNRIY